MKQRLSDSLDDYRMNEVLDAVPPRIVARRDGEWYERGVACPPAGVGMSVVSSFSCVAEGIDPPLLNPPPPPPSLSLTKYLPVVGGVQLAPGEA